MHTLLNINLVNIMKFIWLKVWPRQKQSHVIFLHISQTLEIPRKINYLITKLHKSTFNTGFKLNFHEDKIKLHSSTKNRDKWRKLVQRMREVAIVERSDNSQAVGN